MKLWGEKVEPHYDIAQIFHYMSEWGTCRYGRKLFCNSTLQYLTWVLFKKFMGRLWWSRDTRVILKVSIRTSIIKMFSDFLCYPDSFWPFSVWLLQECLPGEQKDLNTCFHNRCSYMWPVRQKGHVVGKHCFEI